MNKVNVKILDNEFFAEYGLPTYATAESAGMDIRACVKNPITIPRPGSPPPDLSGYDRTPANSRVLIPTGLAIDLNDPTRMWVLLPKSGLGHKKGLVLGNLLGVIDSDYHLEVFVSCWNTGLEDIVIKRGDFVCQAILMPVLRVEWNPVEVFDRLVDRMGGFGSTGSR